MILHTAVVIELSLSTFVFGEFVPFECDSFPDESGWALIQAYCDPEVWIDDGWFFQHVDLCPGDSPPGGQSSAYRHSLEEFIGEEEFFIEWMLETDADRTEDLWAGGARFAAGSQGAVNYRFRFYTDLAKLTRDNTLPIIEVDIESGVPHIYRLELIGAGLYGWYIDGVIVDSGIPEGAYPSFNPTMVLLNRAGFLANTTRWNYLRWGSIAPQGSGDINTDGEVNQDDLYYFQECLTTEAGDWAGCVWADMDFSGGVDCTDWALFLAAWTDPAAPPCMLGCDCHPADFDGDGGVNAFDLALLLGSWGPCPDPPANCPADLNADGFVNAFDLAMLLGSWG